MKTTVAVAFAVLALWGCFASLDIDDSPATADTRGVIVGYIARRPVYRLTDAGLGNSCYTYKDAVTCVRGRP